MNHKFTKILSFLLFLSLTSCGTDAERADDYSNESELELDNEKNIEYRPDGDYDTLSNKEKIAKDRRNDRKNPEVDLENRDTSTEMNLHPGKEPHDAGSPNDDKENNEEDDTNYRLKDKEQQ